MATAVSPAQIRDCTDPNYEVPYVMEPIGDSTLTSMEETSPSLTQTIGIGLLQCTSFVLIKSFMWVSSCVGKPSLPPLFDSPIQTEKIVEALEKHPHLVGEQVLNLLTKSPDKLKKALLFVIQNAKESNKRAVAGYIDQLFIGLLSTPEVREYVQRIANMDFTNEEAAELERADAHLLQKQYTETEKASKDIWAAMRKIIEHMCGQLPALYDPQLFHGSGDPMTLGAYLVSLHSQSDYTTLTARGDRYEPLILGIVQLLGFLREDPEVNLKRFSEANSLVTKAFNVLKDERNQQTLFTIINQVISETSPSSKRRG